MRELSTHGTPAGDDEPAHRGAGLQAAAPGPVALPPVVRSGDWWPGGMGHPNCAGSQNGVRYAYFARARRLAIERDGVITLYDTLDHELGNPSAPQSLSGALRFDSLRGPVEVASLPVVAG
jgi:hypothetical protein